VATMYYSGVIAVKVPCYLGFGITFYHSVG